ncbi:MAG: hypothetical protein ABI747_01735 [Candidatus Moraniibacteriota bacterium]
MHTWLGLLKILGFTFLSLFLLVAIFFIYFNLPGPAPREDVHLGMTFSHRYATDLGLDWQATYGALLDEVGVKKMRLPVYWDLVEKNPGEYDWSVLDWEVNEAEKRGVELILTLGQRVPRWPECHIPAWANTKEALARQKALRHFMTQTVKRYQGNPAVKTWQVENEPFLTFFGECPPLDVNFLEQEVALVKSLDPTRPVMLTDSGELSLWYRAAARGDAFGTTLYRKIYKGSIGYFTYPIGPNFFRFKAALVRLLTHQEHFSVIELQAEPWANGWVGSVPLEEQYITMNPDLLGENVDYARQVGFQDIYLWGGEWWYWLKEKKESPAVWERAKELYQKYP